MLPITFLELSDNMTDNQLPQLIPIMFPELIRIFRDEKVTKFSIFGNNWRWIYITLNYIFRRVLAPTSVVERLRY